MGEVVSLPGQAVPAVAKSGGWQTWEGGRCWVDQDGRSTYYIRRRVGGVRYEVKTSATSERAAFAQLERFMRDPEGFDPRGEERREPIYLDGELSKLFLAWSKRPRKEGGAGNTLRWVTQQKLYLAAWAEQLGKVDLRRADLARDILPALKGATCLPQRIAVLKRLYSWLRKVEHKIDPTEDPTLHTLAVPQYEPAQHTRSKARSPAEVRKVRGKLPTRWRIILDFLAATGAHVTEAERFAASGTLEELPAGVKRPGVAGVIVIPKTKSGGAHRVSVSKAGLAAAKAVIAAGPLDSVEVPQGAQGGQRQGARSPPSRPAP